MTDRAVIINGAGTRFTLIEDMRFAEEGIIVPAGFRSDFASIPKVLWSLGFTPLGRHQWAAVLHDWLYDFQRERARVAGGVSPLWTPTRADVDAIFLRQMKRDGVGWRSRWTMYLAVRMFGGLFWNMK